MTVTYLEAHAPLEETLVAGILDVAGRVFEQIDEDDVRWRLGRMPALSVFAAERDGALCGFKIGYAVTSRRYYSWLGGVDPASRRLGVALALMGQQHDWAFGAGFEVIETEVLQNNHAMQQLNERAGFIAAGMRFDKTEPRIIYRKKHSQS